MAAPAAPTKRSTKSAKKQPAAAAVAAAQAALEAERAQAGAARRARWVAEGIISRAWARLVRPGADSLRAMYAHVFVPWHWGAATAAAIAVQEAATAGGAGALSLAVVAAGAAATANLAPRAVSRLARTPRLSAVLGQAGEHIAREPGHARVVANLAAAGAVLTHTLGLAAGGHSPETATLAATGGLLVFLGCSARYWQHHRHHTRVLRPGLAAKAEAAAAAEVAVEQAATDAAGLPDTVYARLVQRWEAVAGPGKVLAGSELVDPSEQPYGGLAYIRLGEDTTAAAAKAQLDRIAAGLRIPAGQIELADHEPEEGEPDPTLVTIRVVSSQIMRRPVALDDGHPRVVIDAQGRTLLRSGRYVDGDGEAHWLLYDGSSMWSGYVGGTTGAGKSSLSNALFLGMLETGCTYTVYIDPKGGQSSPHIAANAHWPVITQEPEQWEAVADGLINLIKARGRLLKRRGVSGFQPAPEFPGVNLIFDEFYEVDKGSAELPKKIAWIARKGRSVGVTITLLTQGYGLEDFGGQDAVRANAGVANAFALKLKANQASIFKRDFPHLPNPALLPDTEDRPQNKGLAVALRGRRSVLRTPYSADERTAELIAQARRLTIDHLDPFSADALDEGSGGAFGRRHDAAEADEAAAEAEIAERERRGRQLIEGERVRTHTTAPRDAAGRRDPAAVAAAAGRAAPPVMPQRVVIDLEAWRRGEDTGPQPAPAAAAVLRLLADEGELGTQQIIDALAGEAGCGATAVKAALGELAEADRIAKGSSRKSPWTLL